MPLQDLPYLVHTNRELGLMLAGTKPLAVFMDGYGHFPDCLVRYFRMFDRHVANGRIVRRDRLEENTNANLAIDSWHWVYFALPGQEWRIDAMIELRSRRGTWTIDREREEGELLGYSDWQNQVWLSKFSAPENA